jgi:hypothetical protein
VEREIVGDDQEELGGEDACLLPVMCPDCGAVLDGGPHRPGCASASEAPPAEP